MGETRLTTQEARQRLYEIIRKDIQFEQKAREALELGESYLQADNGHLTRIDPEVEHWEIMVSTDPTGGQFPAGRELYLEKTYCRRTITANSPIALYDAPAQGWADDPAFEAHGLHCYHGTPLIVEGEPYGTVCFVGEDRREEPFSDSETMFAELIARLLERELEREQHEAELTRQANLATVLGRVLRHNLRNDIAVIRGFTELMAEKLENDTYSETALNQIDDLIQLCQKARELDRIVAQEFEREPTDIVTVVEEVAQRVAENYPSASISVEYEDTITAAVLPSFERALEELIENAAKHSGETQTITVTIDSIPNAFTVQIKDNGPGLADHEADVLNTGVETPLTHGSGLGLWLAYWIVTSHDGSIDAEATADGTVMTISIPQKPTTNIHQQLTKLTRARDQYQAAFDEAYDAMVLLNDEARIVDANSEAATLYGVENQGLLGRPFSEFLPDEFDFDAAWQEFQQAEAERDVETIIDAEGEERLVEYSATTDIVPGQHLVISRDITEENATRLRQETIIDNLPGYVYRHRNESGWPLEFVKGAAEPITGYTTRELEQEITLAEDIIHPEDRGQVWTDIKESLQATGRFDLTYRIVTKDGETRWIRDQGQLVEDSLTGLEYLDGFITDVTESKERERELQRTQQQLEAILKNTTTPMFMKDVDGAYLLVNREYCELFDLQKAEVIGRTDDEIHSQEMADEVRENDRAVIEQGEPIEAEERIQIGGEQRVFLTTKVPIYDTGEQSGSETPVAVFGVATDITERKIRERQLREEQQFIQSIFRSLPDPLYAFDTDGYPIRWNDQLETVSGYSSQEISDVHITDFVPEEEVETIVDTFHRILENHETVTIESVVETKSGERIPFELAGGPLEDADGNLRGIIGSARDITERREYEQRLEALNRAAQRLVTAETSQEVAEIGVEVAKDILGLDANAIHLYDEAASGLAPVAVTDAALEFIGEPPTFTRNDSIAWRVYEAGEALALDDVQADSDVYNPASPAESELYLPIGEYGILIATSPTPEAFGEQDLLLGDILAGNIATALEQVSRTEELRVREKELTRQNDRLEEFASVLSHDLKNPLSVAAGRLALAQEECDSEHLDDIEQAHARIQTLIDDLLTLAREGEDITDLESVALAPMVEQCWDNVETADATLTVEIDRTILADRSRLKQVFENLIHNAVDHGGEDVTVTVGELDDGFYLADDGPGIPTSNRGDVFQVGYSTASEGTGFGLNIVKQVVDAHGWEIRVTESTTGGARFEITDVEFVE